ncbi:MAG: hypothetical protein HZA08_05715 [Nitrospirae bacterium]|nr:hypothetical protein [Nitrospirota bacterium]
MALNAFPGRSSCKCSYLNNKNLQLIIPVVDIYDNYKYCGSHSRLRESESNVMSVIFDIFKSQVLSYLLIFHRTIRNSMIQILSGTIWYLTAPFPSYISLQSALYYHGMISQIPAVTYSVSPARTHVFKTSLGTFSIHHIDPSLFFGYAPVGKSGIKMAVPEKALIDFLYMRPAKSKLFRCLPELELPRKFNIKGVKQMIQRINSPGRRTLLEKRFQELIASHKKAVKM